MFSVILHLGTNSLGICSCKSFISEGQPYLCKHLYAVHASRHNLKCEEKILNLGKYMVPTLTPYLAEYFKINNHREMFGKSNLDVVNNLIAQSHPQHLMRHLQNELHTTPARDGWEVHR